MPRIFHCPLCEEFFSSEEKYTDHMEQAHPREEGPYPEPG